MFPIFKWPSEKARARIKGQVFFDPLIAQNVAEIVQNVREKGDEALQYYTHLFDGCFLSAEDWRVGETEIEAAYERVSADFLNYLQQAKEKITAFHLLQKPQDWQREDETGSQVGQIYRPLQRVGIYVPGGTASYPSTVLMTVLPALVAGVPEIVMVTPPQKDGSLSPATLVAAREAGVKEIYRVGGAQAIAALAYGTESIPAVDKIVGPGNIYVALAKKSVYGVVGLDMLAGPSEILLIGDGSVPAVYAAIDLLSQAEHDRRARAILVTNNEAWAQEVKKFLGKYLAELPRREIAETALREYGALILTQSLAEAFAVANYVAPEHLELLLSNPHSYLGEIKHAGAIFLGPYTPEVLGDYWAGPSHVLPTGGTARYASPLTVHDFYKCSSIINYSAAGLQKAAAAVQYLAAAEGLQAHGQAMAIRIKGEK